MGYAISSPFKWITGDALTMYVRHDRSKFRVEDDGTTYSELEAAGVDFASSTRLSILADLLKEHGTHFDQTEMIFYSDWVSEVQVGKSVSNFLSFMNRLQDLLFLNSERVKNTFKDDLFAALKAKLVGVAEVTKDDVPVPSLSDYSADIVIRHKEGRKAAVFAVSSERKALEAILFSKELELAEIKDVVPFLVYEETNMTRVNKRTQSRAYNSDLELAAWDGGQSGVVEKVIRHVSTKAA